MKDKLIDLHTHSAFSDGELMPDDLVNHAIANNIGIMSITDHDTLLGNQQVNFNHEGIIIIPGIELSAKTDIGRMHILGYNIDIYNPALNKKMDILRENSVGSVMSLVEQIKRDYGIVLTHDELKELINNVGNIGRPNVAKILVRKGIVSSSQEAFYVYLNNSYAKIKAYSKGIEYEECIDLILKSGGIPVLAHPNTLKKNRLDLLKLIKEMIACGLQGIECYHSSYTKEEREEYLVIASSHNLLISGGSDYHGPATKPDVMIGTGINNNIKIKQLSIINQVRRD